MEKKQVEASIDIAQQHLEEDLGQLKEIVKDKLDVKKRAREGLHDAKIRAREGLHDAKIRAREGIHDARIRAREGVDDALVSVRTTLSRRPIAAVGIAAALGTIVALLTSDWFGRWRRDLGVL
jgi:ElaB/YqjD/DUF883 family membrane-anchored ribosome-binding protein